MGRAYLDLFKLIICIFGFKSVTENMRFLRKIKVMRSETEHNRHVKSSFLAPKRSNTRNLSKCGAEWLFI